MTWAEVARRSNLSKTTTTRIKNNTDHRGHPYQPRYQVVMKLGIGLGLNMGDYRRLQEAAFPQSRLLSDLLRMKTVDNANDYLAEKGIPLFDKD